MFGSNPKAHIAAKTVFHLAHRHGDILREGWKNIMEAMLQLFRAQLLPKAMVEVILPSPLPPSPLPTTVFLSFLVSSFLPFFLLFLLHHVS